MSLCSFKSVTPETNKNFENFGTKKFKDSNMFRVSIDKVETSCSFCRAKKRPPQKKGSKRTKPALARIKDTHTERDTRRRRRRRHGGSAVRRNPLRLPLRYLRANARFSRISIGMVAGFDCENLRDADPGERLCRDKVYRRSREETAIEIQRGESQSHDG